LVVKSAICNKMRYCLQQGRQMVVMIAADGQNMDPALPEMGHALLPGQGREGTTTRDGLPMSIGAQN
jgi:hypothetical protein